MRSYGETCSINQQKPKTKIKMNESDPVHDLPAWLQEFRKNLVDESGPLDPRGDLALGHRDTAISFHELPMESRAKVEPGSGKHSVFSHFPKEPNCDICLKTQITRASCRRRAGTVVPRAENLGDLITADHKVLSEESESRNNHRYAVVVQDLATQWLQSYPCKRKTSQQTQKSLMKFLEPTRKPKVIYTGIAERAVRRVEEGTSAALLQSGLDEKWWTDSMECYTYLRNIQDLLSDGKTPYERRFGLPFTSDTVWSNCRISPYVFERPIWTASVWLRSLARYILPLCIVRGRIWKGDIVIADIEEEEDMDASEIHARRLNAKEVLTPMKGDNFIFPVADGTVQTAGGDRSLRPSTLIQDRRNEERNKKFFKENQTGSLLQTLFKMTQHEMMRKPKNDFWSITGDFIYRHHVEPRVKLYMAEEESFPIPLKYIDVTRTTHTSLDVMLEKQVEDYSFTRFMLLNERPPDG